MTGDVINHLWQSTVFAALIALLAAALRKNRARVRFGLWLAASMKFLLPFSLLVGLGRQLESAPAAQMLVTQVSAPAASYTIQFASPFANDAALPSRTARQSALVAQLPRALAIVWLAGFGAILLMRVRAWHRVRAAVRSSTPLSMEAPAEVRVSTDVLEPAVVGSLHPVLLLPSGITNLLTPTQLDAVLAHEFCHVRRRDNLTSLFHMIVEAVFWFHPLVWWIGGRLLAERERACDEAVLRQGNEPRVYAEGILNVCKLYQESPLTCVSGVTGSDIRKRVELILKNHSALKLTFGKVVLLLAAAVVVLAAPLGVGLLQASAGRALLPGQNLLPDSFEVVSIRPADPNPAGGGGTRGGGGGRGDGAAGAVAPCSSGAQLNPGRININNVTVFRLLTLAYGINCRAAMEIGLISGLPDWARAQRFDIQATIPAGAPTYTMQELQFGEAPQLQSMIATMLADRFRLVLHRGTKDAALYNLVYVRGDKIKLSEDQTPPGPPPPPSGAFVRQDPSAPPPAPPRGSFSLGVSPTEGLVRIAATAIPIKVLINIYQGQEAHFVVDKTGMKGLYDIPPVTLDVGPYDVAPGAVSVWPEIMQQLGLRLDSARGPLETLIIDRVEAPSAN